MIHIGLDGEQAVIAELVESLRETHPSADPESVSDMVHRHWATYDGAKIRDYLPVLVAHSVRAELQQSMTTYAPDARGQSAG